jgi:D-alanyl-D-alanine carboxypeptidase (penicillin-binding protein 5/6)
MLFARPRKGPLLRRVDASSIDWGRSRRSLPRLRTVALVLAAVVVLVGVGVGVQLLRPLPVLSVRSTLPASLTVPGSAPALPWPPSGQATVAVEGVGPLGSSGGENPVPNASLTKVMTAYLVLSDHPLDEGGQGPNLTMTPADVAAWQSGAAQGESELKVSAGEQLSERQALEALLVPSANNIAAALAVWDAGSQSAFVTKMNNQAAALGMRHTHYADAIGLDAGSESTAPDQVILGQKAMALPVFAAIVAQPQATFPVAGTVFNYNSLVGHDGIVGIKTGSTEAAGGNFLFAARRPIAGKPALIVGAVLSQHATPILQSALNASRALIDAAAPAVQMVEAVPAATVVGQVSAPWGASTPLVTTGPAELLGWSGLVMAAHVALRSGLGRQVKAGERVGSLLLRVGGQTLTVGVEAKGAIVPPGVSWRLRRL